MDMQQNYTHRKNIIFLIGPTAIGKTEVSIRLAKMINAEIISCDSMQVYKGMDMISQKPTKFQQRQIPHHMIDIVSPVEDFNVADYRKYALKVIKDIHKKQKIPLFVGGGGLYMKALIDGLFPSPAPDFKLREKLKKSAESKEKDYLHKRLEIIDPETANVVHPNDIRRIIRALEIYYKTGITLSRLKKKTKGLSKNYDIKIFCLNRQRDELYDRINKRVNRMFKQGIITECKHLKRKKLSLSASQILGLKEIFAYLDKKCTKIEAKEMLKRNTRHFAKRQLSWSRNEPRAIWINIKNNESQKVIAQKIKKLI